MPAKTLVCAVTLISAAELYAQATLPETPATVPASAAGTYDLVFNAFTNTSPFTPGQRERMVLTPEGDLCVAGLRLAGPVRRGGRPGEVIWRDAAQGLEFTAPALRASAAAMTLNVTGTNGALSHGRFNGARASDDTDCPAEADPLAQQLSEQDKELFDLAQKVYPEYFSEGTELRTAQGFIYRYYPPSEVYLGIRDDNAYVLGGPFGGAPENRGSVADTLAFLREREDARDSLHHLAGQYDLHVSGTRTVTLKNLTTPPSSFALEFNKVSAPDPEDMEDVRRAIQRTLYGISDIEGLDITIRADSAQRISFGLVFQAVQKGLTVNYDMDYDYSR